MTRPNDTASGGAFLGIDVGGTTIKWVVLQGGVITATGTRDTPRIDHESVLKEIVELVGEIGPRLEGIAVALPGTVDAVNRSSIFIPNLPGEWGGLAVADRLERALGLPVGLVNDARAFAWAEHTMGAARGVDDALFVTLGTGVGGAIALRGEILTGAIDAIGEMGHVPVLPDGEHCACGGTGCLETVASASAIASRLARTVAMDQSPILRELTDGYAVPLTAEIVAEAARDGDPWARDAFARAGEALGRATAAVSLVLQLDAVVIGGGLGLAADLYLPTVQAILDSRASLTGRVEARTARFGSEAGAIGAAAFASHRIPTGTTIAGRNRT